MEKWIDFYEEFFTNRTEAINFVAVLEAIQDPSQQTHRAKVMMHQTQRLCSLANDLPKIRNYESLQLLFLIICTENIAKLYYDFNGQGQSKEYVIKFFTDFINPENKIRLEQGFSDIEHRKLNSKSIAERLYKIRCDIVHEGKYWDFNFLDSTDNTSMINLNQEIIAHLSQSEFRKIIGQACVDAILKKMNLKL
ncbi:MAG: HEPN domain-containing protein [Methylococcales bacterium]|nr:HEPN domain-containing protein [Methylococcales bacterium]